MAVRKAIDDEVKAYVARKADAPQRDAKATEVSEYIQACVNNGVDVVGQGFEGLKIKGGLVWFHSATGAATGVPDAARVKQALDAEAVTRLLNALKGMLTNA